MQRTARYFQLGELSEDTRQVWFVCHGYGQLAEYFIRHFAHLAAADPTLVVVAPEGLSRFYLDANHSRVGATWMTREDRLAEIDDYVGYLNQLAQQLLAQVPATVRLTVLGFSQGTSTVSRWLSRAPFRPARLVLWAGDFPPDLEPAAASALLHALPVTLVAGDQDGFMGPEKIARQQALLRQLGAATEVISFVGRHTLDADVLRQLL